LRERRDKPAPGTPRSDGGGGDAPSQVLAAPSLSLLLAPSWVQAAGGPGGSNLRLSSLALSHLEQRRRLHARRRRGHLHHDPGINRRQVQARGVERSRGGAGRLQVQLLGAQVEGLGCEHGQDFGAHAWAAVAEEDGGVGGKAVEAAGFGVLVPLKEKVEMAGRESGRESLSSFSATETESERRVFRGRG